MLGSNAYQWVLDADITACFDEISPPGADGLGSQTHQGQARSGAGQRVFESGRAV